MTNFVFEFKQSQQANNVLQKLKKLIGEHGGNFSTILLTPEIEKMSTVTRIQKINDNAIFVSQDDNNSPNFDTWTVWLAEFDEDVTIYYIYEGYHHDLRTNDIQKKYFKHNCIVEFSFPDYIDGLNIDEIESLEDSIEFNSSDEALEWLNNIMNDSFDSPDEAAESIHALLDDETCNEAYYCYYYEYRIEPIP